MDLKQLRYFVQVAELGSFATASDVLDVAQSTLSRQIRSLEVDIGATLFNRTGRGIQLTAQGMRFVNEAQSVLRAADAAINTLHEGDRRLRGHIVCGLTPSVARVMVPEFVRRFAKHLPAASLSVVNMWSVTLHDHLRAGRLDFALVHRPSIASRDISVEVLRRENLYVVERFLDTESDTVPLKYLDDRALVLPSTLHSVRRELEVQARRLGVRLNIVLELDVVEALFELVADGLACTVSTKYPLLAPQVAALTARRITNPEMETELCLATPLVKTMTPLQNAAADLARDTFNEIAAREPAHWTIHEPAARGTPKTRHSRLKVGRRE